MNTCVILPCACCAQSGSHVVSGAGKLVGCEWAGGPDVEALGIGGSWVQSGGY
jgi:hypothetical protein